MKRLSYLLFLWSFLLSYSYAKDWKQEKWEYSFIKALNYEEKGDLDRALSELEQAYAENPKELLILRELAYCYGQKGELEKAERLYRRVLELDAKDENALQNLERIELLKKK